MTYPIHLLIPSKSNVNAC